MRSDLDRCRTVVSANARTGGARHRRLWPARLGGWLLAACLAGSAAASTPPELDLIFASRATIGTAAGAPTDIAVADVDGDGHPDVIVANGAGVAFTVHRNLSAVAGDLGSTAFAAGLPFGAASGSLRLAVADLDGDGKPEVVVNGSHLSSLLIFKNLSLPGGIAFSLPVFLAKDPTPPSGLDVDVAVGDLNRDGQPEIVATSGSGRLVLVYRNLSSSGALAFASRQEFAAGTPATRVAVGDLDGDGLPDLALQGRGSGGAPSQLSVLRNLSSPAALNFATPVSFPTQRVLAGLAVADLDQDSKLDVVAADHDSGEVVVWRNTAVAGQFTAAAPAPSLAEPIAFPAALHAANLCVAAGLGNRRPDVLVVDMDDNALAILGNDSEPGAVRLSSRGELRTGNGPSAAALADLDQDGQPDLAVTDKLEATVHVRRNTASVTLPVGDGGTPAHVPFSIADAQTPAQDLQLTAWSSNAGLFAADGVAIEGNGANRTLALTPQAGAAGVADITVKVTNASGLSTTNVLAVLVGCDLNGVWPQACPLTLSAAPDGSLVATIHQALDTPDASRWFRFTIQPESQIFVTLTELRRNYDLFVFRDIQAVYEELLHPTSEDLARLGAEFAPAAFSPAAFSPAAFSPAAFSPAAFSPAAFSPAAFSPAAFSPAAFSPAAFSRALFSPAAFSPAAFSPAAFSPAAFSPAAFSPAAFSPAAFSGAQTRSLVAVSAFPGSASEGVFLNTWQSTGDFYLCVRGRNGTFAPGEPFRLDVRLVPGGCTGVKPLPAPTLAATPGPGDGFHTLILADFGRLNPTGDAALAARVAAMQARLATFAARPEVAGVVVDVGADAAVAFANQQADTIPDCVFAKNLVAGAIRDVVRRYRELNPALEYVVLVGDDDVIPFFRHPDTSGLASESNFVVPVLDMTASQASLRLGYVLSQDDYGAVCAVTDQFTSLPLPDLAVGRLVETPDEIAGLIDAYLATDGGQVAEPQASLVTGYDFLADAAEAIDAELRVGMGNGAIRIHDRLIAPRGTAPQADPDTTANWTATQLANLLFARRHDLIFLAGHFNDGGALAADYETQLKASQVVTSAVDMVNAIVFGAGCHVGYNTVDRHAIPEVTQAPDWSQAFARKRVTAFVGGTGYQYGDTDLIEYNERLYLEFARQLRTGTGPVAVGKALLAAKRAYLRGTPVPRGIHEKTLLETTLFGFPMLSLNLPGARLPSPASSSIVTTTSGYAADPGATLGLHQADVSIAVGPLTEHSVSLQVYDAGGAQGKVTATYLSGTDGQVSNPAEPVLPLVVADVTSPTAGEVLRGVGFRGGSYEDHAGVLPLTGTPATEIRGVATAFQSDFFVPVQPWNVDYSDSVCDGGQGRIRLNLFPAQHQSGGVEVDQVTRRQFTGFTFRLFYSGDVTTYTDPPNHPDPDTPALAGAPTITGVEDVVEPGQVLISAQVVGNPAAGIQEVWVTFTATTGDWRGEWESLDLTQQSDTRVWAGTLNLPANVAPADVRYLVQAVNGVGLVAMDANGGGFYTPGQALEAQPQPPTATTLTFDDFPLARPYGEIAQFSAVLATAAGPLAGQRVVFGLGQQQVLAVTDGDGRAKVALPLVSAPVAYRLQATFAGTADLGGASATTQFSIVPQDTEIVFEDLTATRPNLNVRATLRDVAGHPLSEQSIFFVLTDATEKVLAARPVITDYAGRASLGTVPLSNAGTYTLRAYYNGQVPLNGSISAPTLATVLVDSRYNASTASGTYTFALVAAPATVHRTAGQVARVNVHELLESSRTFTESVLSLVSVQTATPDGAIVAVDPAGQWITYQPPAGPDAAGSFTYTIGDQNGNRATGIVTVDLVSGPPTPSLVFVGIEPGATGGVRLRLTGVPFVTYQIQARDTLDGGAPWNDIGLATADAAGEFEFTDPDGPTSAARYYRAMGP